MNRMMGFCEQSANRQRQYEEVFSRHVSNDSIAEYSKHLASRPSRVGTYGNEVGLYYSIEALQKAGLDPYIQSYDVYMSVPQQISVRQTAPVERELDVIEDVAPGTPFADEIVPGYNAYSPAGTVEAELVYANYGRPEDFEELERLGISVKGKIVITRYGKNFRGVKPKQAAKRGAIGMLIYSDPIDDGYIQGKVYPDGPWRPEDSIQRGSIVQIADYPGDPLTPGEPSIEGVQRLDPAEASSLPTIPTTPLSYGQARHLLNALEGEEAPESWQGGLPFSYRLGPGPTKVRISLDIDYERRDVNNVIAQIPGSKYPEQTVVIGAHRDAWVYGAEDNISGWVTAMEIARVLGELYQKGWQPKRSIIIAGWDGEEYGLLGSTEWVEDQRQDLTKNAVAYFNMDGTSGQFFGASAVPSLQDVIFEVTKEIVEPRSGDVATSIYDDWYMRSGNDIPTIGYLGSGSDYTPFIQHLGIASADFGFSSPSGLYHSAYANLDSLKFVDPGYEHQGTAAKVVGLMALRFANADVFPFRYSKYADLVIELLRDISEKYTFGVDLSEVIDQAQAWKLAVTSLEHRVSNLISGEVHLSDSEDIQKINESLLQQERNLTQSQGIPGRTWYKHQIWAPGRDTGYAAQPLPALEQALEDDSKEDFKNAIKVLKQALKDATQTALQVFE